MNLSLEHLLGELEGYLGRRGSECAEGLARRCKAERLRLLGQRPKSTEWNNLAMTDDRVHRAVRLGLSAEDVAVMLAKDNETLKSEISRLHSIAPQKIVFPDGTIRVWHCPHDRIPETKLGNS